MDALLEGFIRELQAVHDNFISSAEKARLIELLGLMSIESNDVSKLRDSHVDIAAGLANMHYILKSRISQLELMLAPIAEQVISDYRAKRVEKGEKDTRLTIEQREKILTSDTRSSEVTKGIAILTPLKDNIEKQFIVLDHRMRMLHEKSVSTRHETERYT